MAVYRVPLKKVFRKNHPVEGDPTWNDIYGNARCNVCKKRFAESDPYIVVVTWKKHTNGSESPTHKYQHTDCTPLKDNPPIRKKEKEKAVKRK
jgi:hypothetical protein